MLQPSVFCSPQHAVPNSVHYMVQLLMQQDHALQAYFMLDEMLLAGEMQEPSKKASA